MPSYALNNFTAPDKYLPPATTALNGAGVLTGPATLYPLPLLDHININVQNSAVYWSPFQTNALTTDLSGTAQQEVYLPPGFMLIQRANLVGIQVRAAVPALSLAVGVLQAQVTVEAVEL